MPGLTIFLLFFAAASCSQICSLHDFPACVADLACRPPPTTPISILEIDGLGFSQRCRELRLALGLQLGDCCGRRLRADALVLEDAQDGDAVAPELQGRSERPADPEEGRGGVL